MLNVFCGKDSARPKPNPFLADTVTAHLRLPNLLATPKSCLHLFIYVNSAVLEEGLLDHTI